MKEYYPIHELAKLFDLCPDTLRYYERIGLLPRGGRTAGGNRDYSEEDCHWVEFIKCMRAAGLSIEALVEYVALVQQGDETLQARKQLLIEQRFQLAQRIQEMNETLQRLDHKIAMYDDQITRCERKLKKEEPSQ